MSAATSDVILPTNSCFDDAVEIVGLMVAENPAIVNDCGFVVVHAHCLKPVDQPDAGEPFAHAWIEHNGRLYQAGIWGGRRIHFSCDAASFREGLRIQHETRYTMAEAVAAEAVRGIGPWELRYRELCHAALKLAGGKP